MDLHLVVAWKADNLSYPSRENFIIQAEWGEGWNTYQAELGRGRCKWIRIC